MIAVILGDTVAHRTEVWKLGRRYGNNFDVMRLALAIAVIYSHAYPLALGKGAEADELLARLTGNQISFGALAVYCFFAISGLLVASSLEHSRGVVDFLRKRALRIYPGFLASYALSIGIVGLLGATRPWDYLQSVAGWQTLAYGLLLYEPASPLAFVDAPFPYQINGSLWTIKYEAMSYIALALLVLVTARHLRTIVGAIFVGSLALLFLHGQRVMVLPDTDWRYWIFFFGRASDWIKFAPFFLAGATFYLFRHRIPKSRTLFVASCVILLLSGKWGHVVTVAPVFLTYVLFHMAFSATVRVHWWADRFGDLSYGTYLYGFAVQQLLVRYIPLASDPILQFIVATAISLVLAVVSWRLVESPALDLKRRSVGVAGGRLLPEARRYPPDSAAGLA